MKPGALLKRLGMHFSYMPLKGVISVWIKASVAFYGMLTDPPSTHAVGGSRLSHSSSRMRLHLGDAVSQ